jgi:hypothetical protein
MKRDETNPLLDAGTAHGPGFMLKFQILPISRMPGNQSIQQPMLLV